MDIGRNWMDGSLFLFAAAAPKLIHCRGGGGRPPFLCRF